MLLEISWVEAPCSSTAAAMVDAISSTERIVSLIDPIAAAASLVAPWMAEICEPISSVAFAV